MTIQEYIAERREILKKEWDAHDRFMKSRSDDDLTMAELITQEAEEDALNNMPRVLDMLEKAREALQFYAKGRPDRNAPNTRMEFGCGCCSGITDENGDTEYDSEVIGLTAREALKEPE